MQLVIEAKTSVNEEKGGGIMIERKYPN